MIVEFSFRTRQHSLTRLSSETFDVLVIGGGITGAGIAWDAALRGFRVALVEKEDFAAGTSSRSAKLIHGGVRYLENFDLPLVSEASHERDVLRHIAPRLVRPLPFLYPVYKGASTGYRQLQAGMYLYDGLATFHNVGRHRMLPRSATLAREPLVNPEGLVGAAEYWDCLTDDARLTLAVIQAAHRAGATVANHVAVTSLLRQAGRVAGAEVEDRLTGQHFTVKARVGINATGPWVDAIRALDEPAQARRLRLTKGIHLVVPRERTWREHAVVFQSPRDGRWLFRIPWGTHALIGTTETEFDGDLDAVQADPADVTYVLEATGRAFPAARLTEADVVSTFAGVRPLIDTRAQVAYRASREHQLFESDSGLISIAGGKLTTFRAMARDAVDLAARRLAERFGIHALYPCRTTRVTLADGDRPALHARLTGRALAAPIAAGLPADVLNWLTTAYGDGAEQTLALIAADPALGERIVVGLPYVWAEAIFAVRYEMALTVSDFLRRRTQIAYRTRDGGLAVALDAARRMGRELGWDEAEVRRQVEAYRDG